MKFNALKKPTVKKLTGFTLTSIIIAATCVSSAFAQDAATLEAISSKLDRMQAAISARLDKLEKAVDQVKKSGGGDPDAAAKNEFRAIHGLVGANKFAEAKTKLTAFSKKYAGSSLAPHAQRLMREVEVVGKATPKEWKIDKWLQGKDKIDLASSKTTFVVFWELWCPHCKREVPKIQQLYEKYSPKGFQIIGLTKMSRGKSEKEITDFISSSKVTYPMAKESGDISEYFAVAGIPAAVVIKGGKVVWRGHPGRMSEDMIKGWL